MNKRKIGKEKEELACAFFRKKGYEILAVNYTCRTAEIDIIARDSDCLVFAEVKYRKDGRCGGSRYAVPPRKRQRIVQGAVYYMYREKTAPDTPVRFDVVAIEGERIFHFKNAFDAMGQSPMGG